MDIKLPDKTDKKQNIWKKGGQSPNPTGRPKGQKNKATIALQALLEDEGERITRKAVELALDGDIAAIKLIIERIIPPVKSSPIQIDLPEVTSVNDCLTATTKIIQSVTNGEITPEQASSVINLLDKFSKTYELSKLEYRVTQIEKYL